MPKGDYAKLKADIEDGVVPIAHLLLEAAAMANLHGVAKGILMFIWRRTYGWVDTTGLKHKTDRIKLDEFASAVNSERTYVSKQLKALVSANVIVEAVDGRCKRYGMNTEVTEWSDGVLDKEALFAAIEARLYVHSSRQTLSYGTTVVSQNNSPTRQKLFSGTTQRLSSGTTFTGDESMSGAASATSKESKERNKEINVDDDERARMDMSIKEFEREVEIRMQLRLNKPQYRLANDDYKIFKQMLADDIDRKFILDGIDEAFDSFVPKHSLDRVHSFSYCAYRIYNRWQAEQSRLQTAVGGGNTLGIHRGSRASPGGPNGRTKSITGGKVGRV